MSASCAPAAPPPALPTGGTETSTWDLQYWCRRTAGSLIPGSYKAILCQSTQVKSKETSVQLMSNISSPGTSSRPPGWTSWGTPSQSTDATLSWTAPRPAPRYVWLYRNEKNLVLIILIVQGLNPGKAIAEIKKLLAGIADKGQPGLKVEFRIQTRQRHSHL